MNRDVTHVHCSSLRASIESPAAIATAAIAPSLASKLTHHVEVASVLQDEEQ